MKNLIIFLTLLTALCTPAYAQLYIEKQNTDVINLLPNSGFESGYGQWVVSAGTVVGEGGSLAIHGLASLRFTPTATPQVVRSKLYATRGLSQHKCEASMWYYTDEVVNPYKLRAIDSTEAVIASQTLAIAIIPTKVTLNFDCNANPLRVEILAATPVTFPITFDSVYLGSRRSITSIDVTNALGYAPAQLPISLSDGVSTSGTLPQNRLQASGVVSGTYARVTVSSQGTVTSGSTLVGSDLPDSGVVSGTYTKVAVNSKGVVTSGTTLVNNDLPNSGVVSGTYAKLTVNSKGVATSGTTLVGSDLPDSGVVSGTYTKLTVNSKGVATSGSTTIDTSEITSGTLPVARGGTGNSTYATGDLNVGVSGATTLSRLPIGTSGQHLKVVSGTPGWVADEAGGDGVNLSLNPSFEANVDDDWLFNAGTKSRIAYVAGTESNMFYAQLGFSAGSSYTTVTKTVPTNLRSGDCEASADYIVTSGAWNMEVLVSGAVIASQTVTSNSISIWQGSPKIFYPCGTTTTALRFRNTADGILQLDNVYLGKIKSSKTGAVVGPWTAYTVGCSGTWVTNTTYNCRSRQVGDSIQIQTFITLQGAPTAVTLDVNLPNGAVIDTSKKPGSAGPSTTSNVFGTGKTYNNAANVTNLTAVYVDTTKVRVSFENTSLGQVTPVTSTAPFTYASGMTIDFEFSVPIVGLSGSNTTFDSRCPNDISCENVFQVSVASNGVKSEDTSTLLSGSCTSTSPYSCPLTSGFFASAPKCWAIANSGLSAVQFVSATSSTVTIQNNSNTAGNFTLFCKRDGDYVAKRTIEGFMSKTVTSTGNFIERMERVRFGGAANENTVCSTSPCTIYRQSGGISSITRTALGYYRINFFAGTFSDIPICHITSSNGGPNAISSINSQGVVAAGSPVNSATAYSLATFETGATTQLDSVTEVVCHGPR